MTAPYQEAYKLQRDRCISVDKLPCPGRVNVGLSVLAFPLIPDSYLRGQIASYRDTVSSFTLAKGTCRLVTMVVGWLILIVGTVRRLTSYSNAFREVSFAISSGWGIFILDVDLSRRRIMRPPDMVKGCSARIQF